MTFGLQCDETTSVTIMNTACEAGITFFDTADVYPLGGDLATLGRTEEVIGKWMKGKRESIILATKFSGKMGAAPWQQGSSRKHILSAIDASLKRLGTDYVDLYQAHHDDPGTPLDETLDALNDVVRAGKARYVGCSNFQAWRVARALGRSEAMNVARLASVQPRYNLLFRQIERDLLPLCLEEGIAVMTYNPLAGGLLTGKHEASSEPDAGSRFALGTAAKVYTKRYWHEREFQTVSDVVRIAGETGVEPATLAVAWVLDNPAITSVIVGASKPEQLKASVAAATLKFDTTVKRNLDELSHEYRMGDAAR